MSETAAEIIANRSCPNCGAEGAGVYCPTCGEMMEPRVMHIRHYFRDIVQEVLSLDTKVLNSVPALLFRPGFLAQEFVAGRRIRYLSPLRLHIIIGIFFFLAFGHTLRTRMEGQFSNTATRHTIDTVFTKLRQQQIARGEKPSMPTSATEFKDASNKVTQLVVEIGPYVLLICLTPAFALFLWLLYRKRKLLYVEHLMFSLYFFSFGYLIAIPGILWLHKYLMPVAAVLFYLYLFFALRRYYADRGAKLVLRTLASILACSFIMSFAFVISYLLAILIGNILGELPGGFHGVFNIQGG